MSAYQDSSCWEPVSIQKSLGIIASLTVNRGIVLPVAALVKQYKENPGSAMLRHFDLMFIQQSIGKLSATVSLPSVYP